jgi:protein-tyrosine-phosphatase/phosphohistidine swiveling domain-containing protein
MLDSDDSRRRLIEALQAYGIEKTAADALADGIRRDTIAVMHWDDEDVERVVLPAFRLARTKALLERAARQRPEDAGILGHVIDGIDAHFRLYRWPTDVAEDDPALLHALWRQLRGEPSAAGEAGGAARAGSESHRILRSLLGLPLAVSAAGTVEPVADRELAAALRAATNRHARAAAEAELQARHPGAYGFLRAVYGSRRIATLHRLIDLGRIGSQGFSRSFAQSAAQLSALTDNLALARNALGPAQFARLTAEWHTLDGLRLIAVLDLHPPGIRLGGYFLAYPVQYSEAAMPPWIQDSGAGELRREDCADAGVCVLLTDHGRAGSFDDRARSRLHRQYLDFQDELIKPNYDALELIVAHPDNMTRLTAQTIVALLGRMAQAYRRIAPAADGDAAMSRYEALARDLEQSWQDLSPSDELPPALRHRITRIGGVPPVGHDTAHWLIRFLHDAGNKALERLMTAARADMSITVGRIGGERREDIQIARLDEAPVIVGGLVRHRVVATIVRAARRLPAPVPGTFVIVRNHLSYSVKLGEHRAELSANIEAPDREGFVRLQSYQGGVELPQQLRGALVRKVLAEAGLTVTSDQDGLVDTVIIGLLNKDHGARSEAQIEDALIIVLRLLWSLRDLDYAMAYLFAHEAGGDQRRNQTERINAFAASFARIFLAEGTIPFRYRGEGMPFAHYCEHTGPALRREYAAYLGEERQMARYRLYFMLNALLQSFDMAVVPPGTGGIGQAAIDRYFNRPLRRALGRGELRIDGRGRLGRNPDYQPLKQITGAVVAGENDALRSAVLLKMSDASLAFHVIGSIDQLTVLRAQLELAPNEWLVVYGLADDENRTILYAFSHHLRPLAPAKWLSAAALRRALRKAGYAAPGRIRIPAFRKLVSHRLLVERPRAPNRFLGVSVRGLLASVGDGSVRIGRVTFDRAFWLHPDTRSGRVLLVPYTTPEDIEAIRAAEAVLVTSGGLLSHAGVTTREFGVPSLILPHAEWRQTDEGASVLLEERYPGRIHATQEGFWVSDSMVSETIALREGEIVVVWASQGIVSTIPMPAGLAAQAHELILGIAAGQRSAAELERWLAGLAGAADTPPAAQSYVADALALVLAEALWDKRIPADARRELMNVVHQARVGLRPAAPAARLPGKTAAHANALVRTVLQNAYAESEQLLSEVEHGISAVTAYWRAVSLLAVVERLWLQVSALADNLGQCDERMKLLKERIDRLRRHPRIALLRTSALDEVASFSGRNLTEAELPAIRKTLRRLHRGESEFRPQKVLLVCTANVDRSPMAEFLLRKMLLDQGIEGIEVCSRGVAAFENRPMSDISQALLLADGGIAPAGHRSRRIAEADVRDADLILAMERSHVDWLSGAYPDAAARIFLISSYGRVPELGDIEDPAGQVGNAYPRMKRSLRIALRGALRRMREEGILARAMTAHLQAKAEELTRAKRRRIAESGRIVVPLEDVDADAVELVGGKGANLGEIAHIVRRHGAQVPPALMVTTFAFERFLDENGMRESFARMSTEIDALQVERELLSDEDMHDRIVAASAAMRNLISQGNLDGGAGVGREIMAAVDAYGLRHGCLSVRSSGLQEDAEEAAFAGAAETFLCVGAADVLHWVKTVWRSFWLTRGILYRSSRIVPRAPMKPAVIIQKMFESEVSGVMFTTDPVSGRDVIVVEAGYGLGEGVVSGLVDVDRYYVDKFDGSVTGLHVGKKAFMVKQDPSGKGTSVVPVDNELRDTPCLKERDIRPAIALAIEEHYALSQDIEFAIADGKFCVLQTRPVTTR